MTRKQSFTFIAMSLMVISALLLPMALWYGSGPVRAETPGPWCTGQVGGAATELYYDDGESTGVVDKGCDPCANYQGVRFSLSAGVKSGMISSVRLYIRPKAGGGNVQIYVMGPDHVTEIIPPITYFAGGTGWHTVNLSGATATGDFWVWVRRMDVGTSVGHDYFNEGFRSFVGEHPTVISSWGDINERAEGRGDIMIRASISQEIHVGEGQDYATIQAAINAASPGLNIVVHKGTYNENVTVSKPLGIRSVDGPTKTIVQSASASRNTFTITAPNVRLSGFTIKHTIDVGSAGVSLESDGCSVISGNVILSNETGIYVSEDSARNILMQNECTSNTNGIYVDGSQNFISGNKLHGNTALIGSAVFLSSTASANQLRFNSITIDAGTGANGAGQQLFNESSSVEVSAVENWWGTADGPSAVGQTSMVGGRVAYDPWLKVPPIGVKTEAPVSADFTVDAKDVASVSVAEQGTGMPVVTVAQFGENPQGKFSPKSIGKWVDALFTGVDGVDLAEIRVHYTDADLGKLKEKSLRLYWWNGEKWKQCSKSGVDKGYQVVWAKVDLKTKPGLNDLQGTFFAVGVRDGGTFSWWMIPLVIVVLVVLLVVFRLLWVLLVKGERAV
jgi:parallel beta-helix repeat protein